MKALLPILLLFIAVGTTSAQSQRLLDILRQQQNNQIQEDVQPGTEGKAIPNTKSLQSLVAPYDVDGLVVNATISRNGHDFYQEFTHYWVDPNEAAGYMVEISELPGRGRAIIVQVNINGKLYIQWSLVPNAQVFRERAKIAAEAVSDYLIAGNHLNLFGD